MSNIVKIEDVVYSVEQRFDQVLSDKSVSFQREAEFALQILYSNDYLCGIGRTNPDSVRDAVTNLAAIGITLNPARKLAYLVPRKGRVCLDISYMGLVELAVSSGSVRWAKAEIVREADEFILNGIDKQPTHNFKPFSTDRGAIVGVYCVAKTVDGDYLTDVMAIGEVYAVRDRSEAWKAWVSKNKSCPWVTDEVEMIKKTIVKRASKMWPKTDRLDEAVHYLNTDGDQGIDFQQERRDERPSREEWIGKAMLAPSVEEMTKISKAGAKAFNEAKDRDGYRAFAEAVQKRGAELRNKEAIDV